MRDPDGIERLRVVAGLEKPARDTGTAIDENRCLTCVKHRRIDAGKVRGVADA